MYVGTYIRIRGKAQNAETPRRNIKETGTGLLIKACIYNTNIVASKRCSYTLLSYFQDSSPSEIKPVTWIHRGASRRIASQRIYALSFIFFLFRYTRPLVLILAVFVFSISSQCRDKRALCCSFFGKIAHEVAQIKKFEISLLCWVKYANNFFYKKCGLF